ncbi:hypothetical protein QF036_003425 [Arthrobacter globiformis]|nr:hypothetical protein [Arthrobacter globiformis]
MASSGDPFRLWDTGPGCGTVGGVSLGIRLVGGSGWVNRERFSGSLVAARWQWPVKRGNPGP